MARGRTTCAAQERPGKAGGYQALRLTVLDDVKLGLLLKRAGKRTRAFLGSSDVEAHWGTNAFRGRIVCPQGNQPGLERKLSNDRKEW